MRVKGDSIKRRILVCLLKLTKEGPIKTDQIYKKVSISDNVANYILNTLSDDGLFELNDKFVSMSTEQRVQAAYHAIQLGADFEQVCSALEWVEFENIAAVALEVNNYMVKRRFRFKWMGRRWEIDVVGCKKPIIICADCKHRLKGWRRSVIMKSVELQVERIEVLADALPSFNKLELVNWKYATLVPIVLSLVSGPFKFYRSVPVVPILQFQSFLNELPAYVNNLQHSTVCLDEQCN